jgi:hypothetical protein
MRGRNSNTDDVERGSPASEFELARISLSAIPPPPYFDGNENQNGLFLPYFLP